MGRATRKDRSGRDAADAARQRHHRPALPRRRDPVRAEIEQYLGADLLFYRAADSGTLAVAPGRASGTRCWRMGATRPTARALCWRRAWCMCRSRPRRSPRRWPRSRAGTASATSWRLGALNVVTTLTGSALLALALDAGRLSAEAAWAAAHVDEDWNMEFWGRDEVGARAPRLPTSPRCRRRRCDVIAALMNNRSASNMPADEAVAYDLTETRRRATRSPTRRWRVAKSMLGEQQVVDRAAAAGTYVAVR